MTKGRPLGLEVVEDFVAPVGSAVILKSRMERYRESCSSTESAAEAALRRGADLVADLFAAADFVVTRFVADFLAACFFAGVFVADVVFFAGVRDAVFFGRAGAIGSLHLDYQMRVKAKESN
jgi:hypothetical protein